MMKFTYKIICLLQVFWFAKAAPTTSSYSVTSFSAGQTPSLASNYDSLSHSASHSSSSHSSSASSSSSAMNFSSSHSSGTQGGILGIQLGTSKEGDALLENGNSQMQEHNMSFKVGGEQVSGMNIGGHESISPIDGSGLGGTSVKTVTTKEFSTSGANGLINGILDNHQALATARTAFSLGANVPALPSTTTTTTRTTTTKSSFNAAGGASGSTLTNGAIDQQQIALLQARQQAIQLAAAAGARRAAFMASTVVSPTTSQKTITHTSSFNSSGALNSSALAQQQLQLQQQQAMLLNNVAGNLGQAASSTRKTMTSSFASGTTAGHSAIFAASTGRF